MELRPAWQDLIEPGERMCMKVLLGGVMTGKRVRALDRPVHILGHMRKEPIPATGLQMREDPPNRLS